MSIKPSASQALASALPEATPRLMSMPYHGRNSEMSKTSSAHRGDLVANRELRCIH